MFRVSSFFCNLIILVNISINFAGIAEAKKLKKHIQTTLAPIQTSLVVDAKNGKVLYAQNAKVRIYPASLTKIMTLYLAFEAVESGKLTMNQQLPVSSNAEKMRPLKLWLKAGEKISVRDAILGLVVKSANDAAVALAEAIAGSEAKFAKLMTIRAHQLGMKDTKFLNASGWHHPEQKTTAMDLVKLSIALKRDYPKFYPLFSKASFEFRGKVVNGHNRLVESYEGAEGLKTGYTIPAGFNLVTTASRSNKSLVGVVTGSKSRASRDRLMVQLLDKHFGVVHPKAKVPTKIASTATSKKRVKRS